MSLACSAGVGGWRAAPGRDRPSPGSIAHSHPTRPFGPLPSSPLPDDAQALPAGLTPLATHGVLGPAGGHSPGRQRSLPGTSESQLWALQVPGEFAGSLGGGGPGRGGTEGAGRGSTEQCGCAETRLCRRPGCSSARVGRTPAERALQGPERAAGGRLLSSRGAGLKDAGSQARVASEPRPGRTVCSGSVTTISRPVGAGQRPPGVGPGHRCGPAQRGRAVAPAAPHCRTRTPKLSPGHGG